jgi:hypothetical protein
MNKNKTSIVYLTGGLGNQLFQIAFLLTRNSSNKQLEITLGRPRLDFANEPDCFAYDFVDFFTRRQQSRDFPITRKAINLILRLGLKGEQRELCSLWNRLCKLATSILVTISMRMRLKVVQATDNGYVDISQSSCNEFIIGYFQSYRWFYQSDISIKAMRNLRLRCPSQDFLKFIGEHGNKKSISVHIRLGDYSLDPTLGILGRQYYENALTRLFKENDFEEIWLFSNDPDQALNIFPSSYSNKLIVIEDASWSAAETLEAMRHGSAYVIANSSLSWWGAALSYVDNPPVISPSPWFKGKDDPRDLIPPEWSQIDGWENSET